MSSYCELIKNFEKIRGYMREFYVYGFKSREEYDKKSPRSYDDERRRIESWLGDYMGFVRNSDGKNVFISIDSRVSSHNPFYKALKSKSFTDGDITLHFILLDILYSPEMSLTLSEILDRLDEYLGVFQNPMVFDESTVRKKLKEYTQVGLIKASKSGKKMLYSRGKYSLPEKEEDLLSFYSEVAPCGVIGSFLLDKQEKTKDIFTFKHHYITSAIDSNVTAALFKAIREKRIITAVNLNRKAKRATELRIIPLRIFISAQNGRQHLLAYSSELNIINSYRIDYLSNIKLMEVSPRFDELRAELDRLKENMWGVTLRGERLKLEYVTFTVKIENGEEYIIRRLEREKRVGYIEKIDAASYRFSAEVYDTNEMIPWIRSFICRITELHFSNKSLERQFKRDLNEMYRIYGIEEAVK